VTDAHLLLDLSSIGADTRREVEIFAIMDEAKDWDLGDGTGGTLAEGTGTGAETLDNDITWSNAPQNDTGHEANLLEEGTGASAVTRMLGSLDRDTVNDAGGIDLDVTDFVNWVIGQNASYADPGFDQSDGMITLAFVHMDTTYSEQNWDFYSKEGADGVNNFAPRIEFTPVPEPATLGLLALGGIALASARVRRRQS
jgi:hypothetical protein